jgi:hypothetical protein
MTPNPTHHTDFPGGLENVPNGLSLILGVWLFVSPWVYGGFESSGALNSWIVGALIVMLAAIRFGNAPVPLRLVSALLGVWVFVSPWVFRYAGNTGRLINSLGVGMLVFFLSLSAEVTKTGPSTNRH